MLQRKTLLVLALLALPLLMIPFYGNLSEASSNLGFLSKSLKLEQQATNFAVQDVDSGSTYYLADFKGRVVILDLFATWCSPCKVSLPYLREIYSTYTDSLVQIISIDIDGSESQSTVSQFRKDENMDWIVSLDPGGSINSVYGTGTIPTFYIIDQQGDIQWSHSGFDEDTIWPIMERTIINLLEEDSGDNNLGGNYPGSSNVSKIFLIILEVVAGLAAVTGVIFGFMKLRKRMILKKCNICGNVANSKCSKCGVLICTNCSGKGCTNCGSRQFIRLH